MSRAVRAVGVLIPARDELLHIERCLDAVFEALERLPPDVAVAVGLVVDRSQDGTADAARAWNRRRIDDHGPRPALDVAINGETLPIGEIRNQGARTVLHRLGAVPPSATLLLSTDADSTVPVDWAVRHLQLAEGGAQAVSGGVLPDGPDPERVLVPDGVYAANLGVGAAAFLEVGGFPAIHSGEDLVLLRRLRAAGHPIVTSAGIYVHTSVRTQGRAVGGLADRIRLGSTHAAVPGTP